MALSTTTYPYNTIVRITDTIGGQRWQGSGVLLSPDEVLTAAHVVYAAGIGTATNITVTPGYGVGSTPYGTYTGVSIHYNSINDSNDLISLSQSQSDFAIIHLSTPVTTGTMGYMANYAGGSVHITGYPGSANGQMIDSQQTVTREQSYTIFNGTDTGAGSSGGPVWLMQNGTPYVVGLVSSGDGTNGYFPQITTSIYNEIKSWIAVDDANLVFNHPPTVAHTIPNQSVTEGLTIKYSVPSNTFIDADNNPLTYTAQAIVNGTAQALPSWLSFNATTETFSGKVPTGTPDVTLQITANDGQGGTVSTSFVLSTPTAPAQSQQVINAFFGIFRQAPTANDLTSWMSSLSSGTIDLSSMITSLENLPSGQITQELVRLYQTAFNRSPDAAGLDYWTQQIKTSSLSAIAQAFFQSPEGQSHFGTALSATSAFVSALYSNALGRTPSASELNYYLSGPGQSSPLTMLLHFSESPESISHNAAAMSKFLTAAATGDTSVYTSSSGTVSFANLATSVAASADAVTIAESAHAGSAISLLGQVSATNDGGTFMT